MLYDLLHNWPLELITFWLFPLFFAYKFVELGRLGLLGRGLPIRNSRVRWSNTSGKAFSVVLIAAGAVLSGAFAYWLCVAVYQRLS